MSNPAELAKKFHLHCKDPKTGEATTILASRNILRLIADLEATIAKYPAFEGESLRIEGFSVAGSLNGEQMAVPFLVMEGRVGDVIKKLQAKVVGRAEVVNALQNLLVNAMNQGNLKVGSFTLVFDSPDGPTVGGETLIPEGEPLTAANATVLYNALIGHAEKFAADARAVGIAVAPQPGNDGIIKPGDDLFRVPLKGPCGS
jgi:hypothetical protein